MSFLNYKDISVIGFEHTTRCNLRCPECARTAVNQIDINPRIKMTEISLDDYKRILKNDLCKQLQSIFFCGSYGDTIASPNIMECLKYLRSLNLKININTNGSLRNYIWWSELAKVMGPSCTVIFSIDGVTKDVNEIYRVNSNVEIALRNAKAYIDAGGNAMWDFIMFEHSIGQLEMAKKMAEDIGFKSFRSKNPRSLMNMTLVENFEVNNYKGKNEQIKNIFDEYGSWKNYMNSTKIECRMQKDKEIYIDHQVRLWPCCWVGGPLFLDGDSNLQKKNTEAIIKKYGNDFNSLKNKSIEEVLEHPFFKYDLESSWNNTYNHKDNPKMNHCVKMCGESYRDCPTDSDNNILTIF